MLLFAWFVAYPLFAQEQKARESEMPANTPTTVYDSSVLMLIPDEPKLYLEEPKKPEASSSGGIVSKPLRTFSLGNIVRFPFRVLKAINPFAALGRGETAGAFGGSMPMNASPTARKEPVQEKARSGNLNPRAWTSMVGWHPGASAFYDPITFEW
jgi:hypothetical protein